MLALLASKDLNTVLCSLKGKPSAEGSDLTNKDVVLSSLLFYQAAVTNHRITASVQKYCCKTVNFEAA